jgi:lipoprotein-anchoring transpeptidase ErfK/SrfK
VKTLPSEAGEAEPVTAFDYDAFLPSDRPPAGEPGLRRNTLVGVFTMRGKILFAAALAAIAGASFATPRAALAHGQPVAIAGNYSPGTIVVRTRERRLYYVLGSGQAIRYPVGVGRAGMQWSGTSFISGKYIRPAWQAPASIRRDYRSGAAVVPGGSAANPMGVAAMTLSGTEYAIHGTNSPGSIGGYVSHGCIRMFNEDITDLYNRVGIGTQVVVQ